MEKYVSNGMGAFLSDLYSEKQTGSVRSVVGWPDPEDVPLRIGLVGAQGTDKNQVAKMIAETLEIPLIERVPRAAKDLGFSLNKNANISTCSAIWFAQIAEQWEVAEFVTDNTLITCSSYAELISRRSEDPRDRLTATALINATMTAFNEQYSIVFYIPPSGEIKPNGYRSRDRSFQAEVDAIMLKQLNNFDVDFFPLVGTPEQKHDLAIMFLDDAGFSTSG